MFDISPSAAAERLDQLTREFLTGPANDLEMASGPEPAFGPALLGYAAGDDPIWETFKEVVDPRAWTPLEAFQLAYPGRPVQAEELSVVSWVLPQTEATLREQREAQNFSGERWTHSRYLGHPKIVDGLGRFLVEKLRAEDLEVFCPDQLPEFEDFKSPRFVFSSLWSQRHVAMAAGLGTFGLCDGLITPVGKAMRCGSLVARLKLPITPRPYSEYNEYCLFYSSGICGKCIKRCPAGAISKKGHDKNICMPYALEASRAHIRETWPELSGAYACGLCQAGVPCEKGIPPKPRRADDAERR